MSSNLGYPDWQQIQQWLGSPLDQATAAAIGAAAINLGPYNLSSWASVVVALKPTGGKVTVTIKQTIDGGPATLQLVETVIVNAGTTLFEAFVLFGDVVNITLQGDTVGETVDYAIYPSNTTTNAQVITNATVNIQHNDALVAAEQTVDFMDAGQNVFTVADDAPNTRVRVTPPRIVTGRVSAAGAILGGSGFTVNRTAVGRYTINFTAAFAGIPVVVVVPIISGGSEISQLNGQPTTTQAFIDCISSPAGAYNFTDIAFHFFAFEAS